MSILLRHGLHSAENCCSIVRVLFLSSLSWPWFFVDKKAALMHCEVFDAASYQVELNMIATIIDNLLVAHVVTSYERPHKSQKLQDGEN